MTIFCDTNIVLEFLQERKLVDEVRRIIAHAISSGDDLFISIGSFYTITYLTEIYLKEDKTLDKAGRIARLRYILNGVLGTFKLAEQHSQSMYDGVNDALFDDLEDSYQAHVAEGMGCDVLLTINDKHFSRYTDNAHLTVVTPVSFIDKFL
jgi:predicted nucleic acid-binding protein